MATTIRSLLVRVGVKADSTELSKFDAEVERAKRGMAALAKAGAVVTGVFSAVAAATIGAGDAIGKGADRARLGVVAFQELGAAAEDAGSSAAALERATAAAANNAARYRQTNEDAARGLADLTSIFRDANGEIRDQEEILYRTADAVAAADNEVEKLSIAQRVFGEGGRELLPLLQGGADGIRRLREEARSTGVVMSEDLVRATEQVNDDLTDLRRIGQGLIYTVGGELIPVLGRLIERFRKWYETNGRLIRQRVATWAGRGARAFEGLARFVEKVVDLFGGAEPVIRNTGRALAVIAGLTAVAKTLALIAAAAGLAKVAMAGAAAAAAAMGAPLGVLVGITAGVIAAVSAFLLVLGDLIGFFRGADSALGRFLARTKAGQAVFSAIQSGLASVGKSLDGFISRISKAPAAISAFFAQIRTGIPFLDRAAGLVEMLGVGTAQLAGDAAAGLRGAVGATDGAFARGVAAATPPSPTQGAGGSSTSTSTTINQGGISISGAGMAPSQVAALAEQLSAGQLRQATGVL